MTTIYFATNHRPNRKRDPDDFGKDFSDDGLANLRFGKASVTGSTYSQIEIEIEPENLSADPRRQRLGSEALFRQVQQEMLEQAKDTLIYNHGFNVSFKNALASVAQLKAVLAPQPLNMVFFSWLSDSSMVPFVAYKNDRLDAAASGAAFARATSPKPIPIAWVRLGHCILARCPAR